MAVAKNEKTGKWYAKFRYHDYTGRTIQKKKEGFDRRSDAQKWEMDFIAQHEGKENISFTDAYKKYMTDCEKRLKVLSVQEKQRMYKYYKPLHNIPISEITPATIREWQNEYLLRTDQKTGKMALAVGTIHHINTMLSTFMSWCKRFYNISSN
ncbi:MAG: Arm DNA-binding domain-containing protein, partial [Schwartzia sp.]|nr:Arm DNA-binding domain-containing protein [Schwartzia sp. (in: firmicutes)]